MRLVDDSDIKKTDSRCRAITGSGNRCKRKKSAGDFCKQHAEKYQQTNIPISEYPAGQIDDIPQPPIDLDKQSKGLWRQVCEVLLENKRLKGIVLHEIYDLCWWDEELRSRRAELKLFGPYNEYVTESGHIGRQRSGVAASVVAAQKKIEEIRENLWLTLEGEIKFKGKKDDNDLNKGIFRSKPAIK